MYLRAAVYTNLNFLKKYIAISKLINVMKCRVGTFISLDFTISEFYKEKVSKKNLSYLQLDNELSYQAGFTFIFDKVLWASSSYLAPDASGPGWRSS